MTFEEFRNAARADFIADCDNISLEEGSRFTARITFSCARRVPVWMRASDELIDELREDLIEELWSLVQSEIGHTDNEMKLAYHAGYDDGLFRRHCEPEKVVR